MEPETNIEGLMDFLHNQFRDGLNPLGDIRVGDRQVTSYAIVDGALQFELAEAE